MASCPLMSNGRALGQQHLEAVGLDVRKEVDSLHQRLQQIEQHQVGPLALGVAQTQLAASASATTDSSMPISDPPMPASDMFLPLAALLAAANPAQQNPKLIGQTLSAMPLALKLFHPKNSAVLLEEEQRVVLENGAVVADRPMVSC